MRRRVRNVLGGTVKRLYELEVRRRRTGVELPPTPISSAVDAARVMQQMIGDRPVESFAALHLNAANKVVGFEEIARGQVSQVAVTPADAYRGAVCSGAAAVIFTHNHPSGHSTPSSADWELTKKLVATGRDLGVPMLDHIVVTDTDFYSLQSRDSGRWAAAVAVAASALGLLLLWRAGRTVAA